MKKCKKNTYNFGRQFIVLLVITLSATGALHAVEPRNNANRAPRDDLSSLLASCNSAASDLAAIGQELCAIQREMDACAAIPLSQADMPVTLSVDDQAYCLTEEVTGDITINGVDVALNLNGHSVNGRIIISGERALVYGGQVIAPAPVDNAAADAGVIQINASAVNTQVVDTYISAADTIVVGVRGARGITVDADDVIIRNSFIQGGNSGGINGFAGGGVGIQSSANNLTLDSDQIFGGNGSDSDSSIITTGNGGVGLMTTAGTGILGVNNTIGGGASGNATNAADGIVLANGGHGINIDTGVEIALEQNIITGGNSGTIEGSAIATGANTTGGSGGDGVHSAAAYLVMHDCKIAGGNVGSTTATGAGGIGAVSTFTGGAGGAGIYLDTNSVESVIHHNTINGGDSGLITATAFGGTGINNVNPFGNVSRGGHGIDIVQQVVDGIIPHARIQTCVIQGGRGVDIVSNSSIGAVFPVQGSEAGHGIVLSALNVFSVYVMDCTITTLNGSNLVAPVVGPAGNNGGNGGDGIRVSDSTGSGVGISDIYIANNQLLGIGAGGDAPGASNTGGDGGWGILIGSGVLSVEVGNNTIAFSPGGGSGGFANGIDNEAIFEAGLSSAVIYNNFAYEIAALLPYVMTVGDAVDAPNGTAFLAAGTNNLFNVYK